MNRQRKVGKGLPRRVYIKHRVWYFVPKTPMRDPADGVVKTWIRLASFDEGQSAMLQRLSRLMSGITTEGSMPYLCAEFKSNRILKSRYSDETKLQYSAYLELIAHDFEEFHCSDVRTKDVADFLHNHYAEKANTAQKVAGLLRRLFRYAISVRGWRQDNPLDQLDLDGYEVERRRVLLTHAQVGAVREAGMYFTKAGQRIETQSGPMFGCLVDMAYLLWQRAIDIRQLKESQIHDGRISFRPTKTSKTSGAAVDIIITPAIQEVIDRARRIKRERDIVSIYLFANRNGQAYAKSGLKSMWDRAKARAGLAAIDMTFRDLRSLAATDAARSGKSKDDLRRRLAHTSVDTSEIYIKEVIPEISEIDVSIPWQTG